MNGNRLAGAVGFLLAVLILTVGFLPTLLLDADAPMVVWVTDSAWSGLSRMSFLVSVLTPVVLVGLFAHQRHRVGAAGLVGLLMALAGMVVNLCFQFDLAFVWPVLALEAPGLLVFDGPMFQAPAYAFVHFWMGPATTVGLLVFGFATYRARVFSRWSVVLFIVGMILIQGMLFPPLALRLIGSVPAAVALAAMSLRQLEVELETG